MIEQRGYELISGRQNLKNVLDSIDIREKNLRRISGQDVISILYFEKRLETSEKEPREIFYVNGTVVTINYNGHCVPISVFGTPEKIDSSLPVLKELIGEELREVNRGEIL